MWIKPFWYYVHSIFSFSINVCFVWIIMGTLLWTKSKCGAVTTLSLPSIWLVCDCTLLFTFSISKSKCAHMKSKLDYVKKNGVTSQKYSNFSARFVLLELMLYSWTMNIILPPFQKDSSIFHFYLSQIILQFLYSSYINIYFILIYLTWLLIQIVK